MSDPFTNNRLGTGTREWSDISYNIGRGCSHNCAYCYARANAVDRWKRIKLEDWTKEQINWKAVDKNWVRQMGVIMYPTTHDITLNYLEPSIIVLKKMLQAGNNVLVVSKPRMECVVRLCEELHQWRDRLLFRFTIGSMNPETCFLWEPGAPNPYERVSCLKFAYHSGYQTSVSIEPKLGGVRDTIDVVTTVYDFVTHDIWIGKMNKIDQRVTDKSPAVKEAIERLRFAQCDESIMLLYDSLRSLPKVAWKDSIKEVVSRRETK